MSNALYTAEQAARVGAALVRQDFVLAGLIARDFEADFGGGSGATVDVRPAPCRAALAGSTTRRPRSPSTRSPSRPSRSL